MLKQTSLVQTMFIKQHESLRLLLEPRLFEKQPLSEQPMFVKQTLNTTENTCSIP